jgi:hypothetical protein
MERRTLWALFDKDTGEMSATARWSHAKACLDAGHEVIRLEFERPVRDMGEAEADVLHERNEVKR